MACSTANAVDNGAGSCTAPDATLPATIWQAILSIARNPGLVSSSGLFSIAAGEQYLRSCALCGRRMTGHCSLTHAGGGLSEPTASAIRRQRQYLAGQLHNG